jgi:mycothiol synthase
MVDSAERSRRLGVEPEITADGGRRWWLQGATAARQAAALELGLTEVRRLHQMRRPLPIDETTALTVRPFDPDRDVEPWLDVNNRAFAFHPDQGNWTASTLQERMREPWFALDDFLVHDGADGGIDGFCWTKVHRDHDPVLGEIYVIGAAPERHGTGLGRALVVAGLEHLWAAHRTPVGMLYVESDNEPALVLYRKLGFTVHADDVAYEEAS